LSYSASAETPPRSFETAPGGGQFCLYTGDLGPIEGFVVEYRDDIALGHELPLADSETRNHGGLGGGTREAGDPLPGFDTAEGRNRNSFSGVGADGRAREIQAEHQGQYNEPVAPLPAAEIREAAGRSKTGPRHCHAR